MNTIRNVPVTKVTAEFYLCDVELDFIKQEVEERNHEKGFVHWTVPDLINVWSQTGIERRIKEIQDYKKLLKEETQTT